MSVLGNMKSDEKRKGEISHVMSYSLIFVST